MVRSNRRETTRDNEFVSGDGGDGLMSGCQIPVIVTLKVVRGFQCGRNQSSRQPGHHPAQ